MDAVEYLKEKARMSENYKNNCRDCPLNYFNNGTNLVCTKFEIKHPEEAVEIVEKWAKENPAKTYLSVLFDKFPNAKLGEDGCPKLCPTSIFNIKQECPKILCIDCWNKEYKEEE